VAKLLAIAVLAVLMCGCGSKEERQTAGPAPEPTATLDPGDVDVEEEYHQPPDPPIGGVGDTITLTGSNIGVRLRVTVTGLVDRTGPGRRYLAVKLRLKSTGIAVFESELRNAVLRYAGGTRARTALGVKAGCSHGFQRHMRLEVGRRAEGCLLFRRPAGAKPRSMMLALEEIPAAAGGRWDLG
jgi:hypothetical protein